MSGKTENSVNIIIEAGEFTFNDSLEAADAKAAREAGRSIVNFALGLFAAPRRRQRKAGEERQANEDLRSRYIPSHSLRRARRQAWHLFKWLANREHVNVDRKHIQRSAGTFNMIREHVQRGPRGVGRTGTTGEATSHHRRRVKCRLFS